MACDLLVLLFVLSPIELPVPDDVPGPMWDALKGIARDLELVGPTEKWRKDFRQELQWVRWQWREMADAPSLVECHWLPPYESVTPWLEFNRAYRRSLEAKLPWVISTSPRFQELVEAIQETEELYIIWSTVQQVQAPYANYVCRRSALRRLRDLLGHSYELTDLPPPVPLWRFDAQ